MAGEEKEVKFTSYPEGYEKALSMLESVPEEEREAYLNAVITMIINN